MHGLISKPSPQVAEARPADDLLVVSWNIQYGLRIAEAAEALASTPALADADLVLLQEMDTSGTELVAERLGHGFAYAPASVHPSTDREFGNAVLSPWPLTDPSVHALPYRSAVQGQPRVAVSATIAAGAGPLRAFSVHTEVPTLRLAKRRAQFEEVGEAARHWEGMRLVVGGDFNTVTDRSIRAVTERLALIGAHPVTSEAGTTLRRGGTEFQLDHIYVRRLQVHSSGVVRGLDVSDHRPLWARLTWSDDG